MIKYETKQNGSPISFEVGMLTVVLPSVKGDGAEFAEGVFGVFRRQGISKDLSMTSPWGDVIDGEASASLNEARIEILVRDGSANAEALRAIGRRSPLPTHVRVEFPETKQHPQRCLEIAEEMIALANAGVYVIATTHSKEILYRIATRVAQGHLEPNMVRVIAFEDPHLPGEPTALRQLTIDQEGMFQGKWPTGLMEEAFNETAARTRAVRDRRRTIEEAAKAAQEEATQADRVSLREELKQTERELLARRRVLEEEARKRANP
jgi:hypothetical protein